MPENRVLAGERISRAQLDAAGTPDEAAIEAALGALDHEQAAMLALARARKETVPTRLVARILPGIEFPPVALALIAIAPDKAALLDVVESRNFPPTKDASELEAIALYAAWKAGAPVERIKPELRRLAARSMTAEGYGLLATVAASIDDANVTAACKPIASFASEYKKQVAQDDAAMHASIDKAIASLPAEVESTVGGFTVRGAKQPGRNDPCPCGSGLKYKKCCADKPVATPSPIPGVAWEDFLGKDAGRMEAEHVQALAPRDLARVDLTKLELKPLTVAMRRFVDLRAFDRAEQCMAAALAKNPEHPDDYREELVHALLTCGEIERARPFVDAMKDKRFYDLELAVRDGKDPWQALVARLHETAGSTDKLDDVDLAYSLLRAEPLLGIYIARACIGTLHVDDADLLLEYVEDARDKLGLPPTDPAWDVLDALRIKTKRSRPEPAKPDDELAAARARASDLERTIDALRTELADLRTRPAAELVRAAPTESGLEARVRELEGVIREGQAERAELRKQLAKLDAEREAVRKPPPPADDDTVDEGDDLPLGNRAITLPRFDRRFADALAEVPAPVAAEAVRTVGILASGDGFAWRQVKQAKDMARQVLMARVGIHHRMLFRVEDGVMDVLDLITRETLLTTLKRLRAMR
ncbi:MAG TPA: SEC-C metal-binding domain-containing protein [Kofleriaceae bacterium]|nr:SEC-C metal-binding domain-containing protein [Kofleriaceae bacterium]